jgi:glutathione S-transferase
MWTLYGNGSWTSPYVLSVFVALREKGLAFRVLDVALHEGAHFSASFAEQSLTSRVPVLDTGDLRLSESSAIVEYLEDELPSPGHPAVLPTDARGRAKARQVMAWIRSDLMPVREERSAENVFYPRERLPPLAPLSAPGERAAKKLLSVAARLVPADSGPMAGAWCIADTDLAMMLQRLVKTGYDVPSKLRSYAEREWQRPAVVEFCQHPRPPYQESLTAPR